MQSGTSWESGLKWVVALAFAAALGPIGCGDEKSPSDDAPGDETSDSGEGGGAGSPNENVLETKSAKIGPQGGAVKLGSTAEVTIPKGALSKETTITVSKLAASSVAPISKAQGAAGDRIAFEPHGLEFTEAVTIKLPRASQIPTGSKPGAMKLDDTEDDSWEEATVSKVESKQVSVATKSFSVYASVDSEDTSTEPCGNGACDTALEENHGTCPLDCFCGDGTCDTFEAGQQSCPTDCSGPTVCGDTVCEGFSETSENCAEDCFCADLVCDAHEAAEGNCTSDCPTTDCGNAVCDHMEGETTNNCADCTCGDVICDTWEYSTGNCTADCGF